MDKVVFIDGGALCFNAIHLFGTMKLKQHEGVIGQDAFIPPIGHTYLAMCISALKRIGIEESDKVIICVDARNSWRKAFYKTYKGQRKEAREKQSHINWEKGFKAIETINDKINKSTNWHVLKFDNVLNLLDIFQTDEGRELIGEDYEEYMFDKNYGIEADDIQSAGCRYFKDSEVILVTGDKDLYQLAYYSNTKIYSLNLKKIKGGKGGYAHVQKPLKILQDKIRLGDISDNIIVDKLHDTPLEQERREFIINLLALPKWIEDPINEAFKNLPNKIIKKDELPYPNSLAKRFFDIYKKDNIITPAYCEQLLEKREAKKKKKAKEKREEKKRKELKEIFEGRALSSLGEKEFNKLKRSGLLWEFYPSAVEFYKDIKMEKK